MLDSDSDRLAAGPPDRLDEPRLVDGEEVALGRAHLQAPSRRDSASRNLGQVMIGLVIGEPHDGPDRTRALLTPEDFGGPLDVGLQVPRLAAGDIGRLDPVLVRFDIQTGNRDSGDAGRDDLMALGWFQKDDEPPKVLLLVGSHAVEDGPGLETTRVVRRWRKDLVDSQHIKTVSILAGTILDANDSCLGHIAKRGPPAALLLTLGVAGRLDEGIPGLVGDPLEALARFEWKQFLRHGSIPGIGKS